MIYLKSYKLFENAQNLDVESTINEILYDLSDIGYRAECNVWKSEEHKVWNHETFKWVKTIHFEVSVSRSEDVPDGHGGLGSISTKEFNWDDIKEVMDRISYYLFMISSSVEIRYYDSNGEEQSWNLNNSNELLKRMEEEFTEYYYKDEGWFRIGFAAELK